MNSDKSKGMGFYKNLFRRQALPEIEAQHRLTHRKLLADTFAWIEKVIGQEKFQAVCDEFVEVHQSKSWALSAYGKEFCDYIHHHEVADEYDFLGDLAMLACVYKELFESNEQFGLSSSEVVKRIEEPSEGRLRIQLVSSMRVFKSDFSLYDIWCSLGGNINSIENWDEPQSILLFKRDQQVHLHVLTSQEAEWLIQLKNNDGIPGDDTLNADEISEVFHFLTSEDLFRDLKWEADT